MPMKLVRYLLWFTNFAMGSALMVFVPAYIDVNVGLFHIVPGIRVTSPNMAPQLTYTLAWVFWLALLPFGSLIERSRIRFAGYKQSSVLSGFIVGASYPVFCILLVLSHWMTWGAALFFTLFAIAIFNPLTAYLLTGGFKPETKIW